MYLQEGHIFVSLFDHVYGPQTTHSQLHLLMLRNQQQYEGNVSLQYIQSYQPVVNARLVWTISSLISSSAYEMFPQIGSERNAQFFYRSQSSPAL